MARARTIKHGFFTNDELGALPQWTRLLFAGLWVVADREGRLLDRPKKIKTDVLPYDNVDVNRGLAQLAEHHFIRRYVVDDQAYIQVQNWAKHQRPHPRELPSELPAEPGAGTPQDMPEPDLGQTQAGPRPDPSRTQVNQDTHSMVNLNPAGSGLMRARTGSYRSFPSGSITGPIAGPQAAAAADDGEADDIVYERITEPNGRVREVLVEQSSAPREEP